MDWLWLFWTFLKVNLLSISGLTSIGLLHHEVVGKLVDDAEFVQAVSFASVLPGSDALQLAMFIGMKSRGAFGALLALIGSLLPPTVLMLGLVLLLYRVRREAWISSFVEGMSPAVAVLMLWTAWKLLRSGVSGSLLDWRVLLLGSASLLAFLFDFPPALVLLVSGLAGILIFQ
uniref:Chromate transporter n=1 Tax=uncultured Chloroflexota bacterium TaxID=166587 RepID=H5SL53_9CHLR|nr:chromate transporter [uncultured Chloroflexota bacterium]BAL56889.1 chromate transporter [uncultured Chloroflexota bacterium]